jgi:hypothetical protein
VLTLLAVLAIGARLEVPGTPVGVVAAFLLVFDASFMLHARRAMGEGTLVAFGAMSIALTAAYMARRASGEAMPVWKRVAYLAGIGLLTGLTVATKLNGAIAAMVVAMALVGWLPWRTAPRDAAAKAGVDLAVVAGVALAAVMALSPFLWINPLARVRETLRDMNALVEEQRRGRDWLETPGERVGVLVEQVFWTQAAYYEDEIWGEWVGDQITRYEDSPFSGWRRPPWARAALGAAFVVGLGWLIARRPTDPAQSVARGVVLMWLAVTALVNLIIIPFAWQRYYLTLWPGVALVEAVGIATLIDGIRQMPVLPDSLRTGVE